MNGTNCMSVVYSSLRPASSAPRASRSGRLGLFQAGDDLLVLLFNEVPCPPLAPGEPGEAGRGQDEHGGQHGPEDGDAGVASGPAGVALQGRRPPRQHRLVVEVAPQVLGHRVRGLVTAVGVLVDRLQDDRLQVARNPAVEARGRTGSSALMRSIIWRRSDDSKPGRSVSSS